MSSIYKVTRVLEHEGPRDWLEMTLKQRAVAGMGGRVFGPNSFIREVSLSAFEPVREMTQEELYSKAVAALGQLNGEMLGLIESEWFTSEEAE